MADHASTPATMPFGSTTTKTTTVTTTSSKSRIGTIEQPQSRLHALPPELHDMIYAYVVVSPDDHYPVVNIAAIHMPSPVAASSSSSSSSSHNTAQGFGRGPGRGFTKKPLPKPQPQQRQTHLYLLYQPPSLHRPLHPCGSSEDFLHEEYFSVSDYAERAEAVAGLVGCYGAAQQR